MVKLRHDRGNFALTCGGCHCSGHHVIGEAGGEKSRGNNSLEGCDHVWSDITGKECQNVGARYAVTQILTLKGEEGVEFGWGDVISLQLGPGVVVRVGGVYPANSVRWKAFFGFVTPKRLKRTGEDDPAEVPQHGLDRCFAHMGQVMATSDQEGHRIAPIRTCGGGSMSK